MLKLLRYYGKYQTAKGAWGGMPAWARWVFLLVAMPGLALLLLSIAAFFVSLFALLLLTVPVYRLLRWLTGSEGATEEEVEVPLGGVDFVEPAEPVPPSTEIPEVVSGAAVGTVIETTVGEPAVELSPTSSQRRRLIEVRIVE